MLAATAFKRIRETSGGLHTTCKCLKRLAHRSYAPSQRHKPPNDFKHGVLCRVPNSAKLPMKCSFLALKPKGEGFENKSSGLLGACITLYYICYVIKQHQYDSLNRKSKPVHFQGLGRERIYTINQEHQYL